MPFARELLILHCEHRCIALMAHREHLRQVLHVRAPALRLHLRVPLDAVGVGDEHPALQVDAEARASAVGSGTENIGLGIQLMKKMNVDGCL